MGLFLAGVFSVQDTFGKISLYLRVIWTGERREFQSQDASVKGIGKIIMPILVV